MDPLDELAGRFEDERPRLRSVAYRLLGSLPEADDAVQEAWVRLSSIDAATVQNLSGWLTTVVSRLCLNVLRSRRTRAEVLIGVHVPDPLVTRLDSSAGTELDPGQRTLLAESVGLALMVVLDTLAPAERVAFVLHDLFDVPFAEIATMAQTTPAAARQQASRARRRVQQEAPVPDLDLVRQRAAVNAFFAASRDGDLAALVAVLDPDVVLRADGGPTRPNAAGLVRGAAAVAEQSLGYGQFAAFIRPAWVNSTPGAVVAPRGRPVSVLGFCVRGGRILAIDVLADPERLELLALGRWDE